MSGLQSFSVQQENCARIAKTNFNAECLVYRRRVCPALLHKSHTSLVCRRQKGRRRSRLLAPAVWLRAIGEIVVSELPLILYSAPCHFYDAFGDAVRFLEANYDSVHPARLLASYAGSNRGRRPRGSAFQREGGPLRAFRSRLAWTISHSYCSRSGFALIASAEKGTVVGSRLSMARRLQGRPRHLVQGSSGTDKGLASPEEII